MRVLGTCLMLLAWAAPALAASWNEPAWELWPVETVDSPGLLDPHVLSLAADRDGGIWIGTLTGGASRYDPADGSWTTYATARVVERGAVMAIHEAWNGTMWFAQSDGIASLDRGTGQWTTAGLAKRRPDWHRGAMWIAEDSRSRLWFVDFMDGVSVLNTHTGKWSVPEYGDHGVPYFSQTVVEDVSGQVWLGGDGGAVTSPSGRLEFTPRVDWEVDRIHQGRSGSIWLAGMGMQVSRMMPGADTEYPIRGPSDDHPGAWDVIALHEDRRGDLWVGTLGEGLWRYRPDADSWEDMGLTGGAFGISLIHEDRRGWIWVGTRGEGLARWDPDTGEWRRWSHEVGRGCPRIEALLEADDGRIWVGTDAGGVSAFDPVAGTWKTLPLHPQPGIPGWNLHLIHADTRGDLWFLANDAGLSERGTGWIGGQLVHFERATGDWREVDLPMQASRGTFGALHRTASGELWLGKWGSWLRRSADGGPWSEIRVPEVGDSREVRPFLETPDGQLWTSSGPVTVRLDGAFSDRPATVRWPGGKASTGRILGLGVEPDGTLVARTTAGAHRSSQWGREWEPFELETPAGSAGPVGNRFRDAAGTLWVATRNGDLHRRDDGGAGWTRFERPRALRGSPASAPFVDHLDGVWVRYRGTAVRFAADGGEPTVFGLLDGQAFRAVAGFAEERDGAIWVLGEWGATRLTLGAEPGRPLSLDGVPSPERVAAGEGHASDVLCWARPAGLLVTGIESPIHVPLGPAGEWATALDGSPEGCWAGHLLSGVIHVDLDGAVDRIRPEEGLPDGRVLDISQQPGGVEAVAWVATDRGAARVSIACGVEMVVGPDQGGTPGAVDHVVALRKGAAVLAYNRFPERYAGEPTTAYSRAQAHLRWVSKDGVPGDPIPVPDGQVTDLAVDAAGWVWVATDRGVLVLVGEDLTPVNHHDLPLHAPVRHLAAHPDDPTRSVYLSVDGVDTLEPRIVRYRHRGMSCRWPWETWWARGAAGPGELEALDVTPHGQVVLLTGGVPRRIAVDDADDE